MPLWTLADLQARLSAETVRQIFDDDTNGAPDALNITRLQEDSDSYVKGFLRPIYDLDEIDALPSPPNELKRLSLDVAEWMACRRWPEYIRGEWKEKRDYTRAELMDLRSGTVRLDVMGSPEPAGNEGGLVTDSGPRTILDSADGTYNGGDF